MYTIISIDDGKLIAEGYETAEAVTQALQARVESDSEFDTADVLVIDGGNVIDVEISRSPSVKLDLPVAAEAQKARRKRRSAAQISADTAAGEPAPRRRGRPRKDTNHTNGETTHD